MRRAPGTGSVYRRTDYGHRRRPWIAIIDYGFTEDGKRDREFLGSFPDRRAAQDALDVYRLNKEPRTAGKITMGQLWERVKAERPNMDRGYISAWRNHVAKLRSRPIAEIKALHLQDVVDKSGLSGGSQQKIATIYHWIYRIALANDIVDKDYSRFVQIAKKEKSTLHRPFTSLEMRTLWAYADVDAVKVILIQCYTGTRPTELATIKTDDVHLTERYMTGGIKTAAGRNRVIPIASCILPLVKYFYNIALFTRSAFFICPGDGIYQKGGHTNMPKLYQTALSGIGVPRHTPHDARHTFVSLADNYGMPETIQKIIVGHAQSADVTKDVYTHKVAPQLVAAVDTLPWGAGMTMYPGEKIGSHVVVIK